MGLAIHFECSIATVDREGELGGAHALAVSASTWSTVGNVVMTAVSRLPGVPSARFSHNALVAAPRAHVWKALDQPETWNSIPGVERVHQPVIDDEGRLGGFLFDTVIGGSSYEGQATPRAREEEQLMSWNIVNSQVRGQIDVGLSDADGGTDLSVSIEIASAGFLAGMFFRAIAAALGDGLPETVETLARKLAEDQ